MMKAGEQTPPPNGSYGSVKFTARADLITDIITEANSG